MTAICGCGTVVATMGGVSDVWANIAKGAWIAGWFPSGLLPLAPILTHGLSWHSRIAYVCVIVGTGVLALAGLYRGIPSAVAAAALAEFEYGFVFGIAVPRYGFAINLCLWGIGLAFTVSAVFLTLYMKKWRYRIPRVTRWGVLGTVVLGWAVAALFIADLYSPGRPPGEAQLRLPFAIGLIILSLAQPALGFLLPNDPRFDLRTTVGDNWPDVITTG